MRKSLAFVAAGILVAVPLIGHVQQVPGEATQRPSTLAELQNLMSTQTEAIMALHKRVVELEARVKKLEEARPGSNP